jgi:AsmA-like C-terminal region/AsmA family
MKKALKYFGLFLLIIIIALIAAPFLFKNKIIELAKTEANKSLNATVNFGAFDLSIFSSFPNFRFKINDVTVVGKGDFAKDTLFSNEALFLDLNLMSVIKGDQYKVSKIELIRPRINAIVLPDGRANWDITIPDSTKKVAASSEPTKFKLSLKELKIVEAYIVYDDKKSNMSSKIEKMNYTMNGDFSQDVFDMNNLADIEKLTFVYAGIPYLNGVKTTLNAALKMDMGNSVYTFKENELGLNDLHLGFDGFVQMKDKNILTDVKFNAKETDFKNILSLIPNVYTKDFKDVKTSGKLALNGFAKGTYNDKSLPAFGAHLKISDAMFKYPSLPKSVNNIQFDVNVDNPNGQPDATVTDIKRLHIEMAGNPVDVRMIIRTPVSDPNIDGTVKGKINLASVREFIPMEKGDDLNGMVDADITLKGRMSSIEKKKYEEFNAQGFVNISQMKYKSSAFPEPVSIYTMQLKFSPKVVDLVALSAVMGKSDFNAKGTIEDFLPYVFRDSTIKGNFTFSSSVLDINGLTGNKPATANAETKPSEPMKVVEIPKNIDFVLTSSIGKVFYDNLQLDNIVGKIIVKDARVTIENTKMNLMDGAMVMNGYYDTKNIKKPTINYSLNITDFDVQKTFTAFNTIQKLAPIGKYTTGKFSCSLNNLTSQLDQSMMPDMSTLTASGDILTKTTRVSGFEPISKLADAIKMPQYKALDVSNIKMLFEVKDGRINIKPFNLKLNNGSANVSGSTGLDQTIKYTWDFEIPRSEFGTQANNFADQLLSSANKKGMAIKMSDKIKFAALIGGTITKPTVTTNLKEIAGNAIKDLKQQAVQVLEQKKEEVIADVKAKASVEAEKILAQAKEQADKVKAEAANLSQQILDESEKQAAALENGGANVFEKLANKKIAETTRKEGVKKAKKVTDEANAKSDAILNAGQEQANKLK